MVPFNTILPEVDKCISVVMAVHNGQEYLEAARQHTLQTYTDLELIVVNDAS